MGVWEIGGWMVWMLSQRRVDWKDRGRKRRRRCFKAGVSSEAHISQEEKKSETRETAEEKRVKRAVELTAELTLRERQSTTGNGKQRRLRHMLSTQNYSICLSMDAHVCTANCIYNRRHGLCCLLCIFVGTENQVETHKNGKRIIFTKVKLLWKEEIELPRFYFWAVFLNLFLIPPKLQKQWILIFSSLITYIPQYFLFFGFSHGSDRQGEIWSEGCFWCLSLFHWPVCPEVFEPGRSLGVGGGGLGGMWSELLLSLFSCLLRETTLVRSSSSEGRRTNLRSTYLALM